MGDVETWSGGGRGWLGDFHTRSNGQVRIAGMQRRKLLLGIALGAAGGGVRHVDFQFVFQRQRSFCHT